LNKINRAHAQRVLTIPGHRTSVAETPFPSLGNNIHYTIEEVSPQDAEKHEWLDDLIIKLADAELLISHNGIVSLIRELVDNYFKFSKQK